MFCFDLATQRVRVRLWISGNGLHDLHVGVAAKLNICTATGHVGGDGHRTKAARISYDLCFLLVLARV